MSEEKNLNLLTAVSSQKLNDLGETVPKKIVLLALDTYVLSAG